MSVQPYRTSNDVPCAMCRRSLYGRMTYRLLIGVVGGKTTAAPSCVRCTFKLALAALEAPR